MLLFSYSPWKTSHEGDKNRVFNACVQADMSVSACLIWEVGIWARKGVLLQMRWTNSKDSDSISIIWQAERSWLQFSWMLADIHFSKYTSIGMKSAPPHAKRYHGFKTRAGTISSKFFLKWLRLNCNSTYFSASRIFPYFRMRKVHSDLIYKDEFLPGNSEMPGDKPSGWCLSIKETSNSLEKRPTWSLQTQHPFGNLRPGLPMNSPWAPMPSQVLSNGCRHIEDKASGPQGPPAPVRGKVRWLLREMAVRIKPVTRIYSQEVQKATGDREHF